MEFIYVSSNKNKFNEFAHLFPCKVNWQNLELTEIQGTPTEIVLHKVNEARQKILKKSIKNVMIIVDDVSLSFPDLANFPGPYVKHFLTIGTSNLKKILKDVNNKVVATCALGISYYDENTNKTETLCLFGDANGSFVFDRDRNNENSFGFDRHFLPDNCRQTYAEMSFKEKNVISHRGIAIFKLIKFCTDKKLLTDLK